MGKIIGSAAEDSSLTILPIRIEERLCRESAARATRSLRQIRWRGLQNSGSRNGMPICSRYFVQSTTALLLVGFLALLGIISMTLLAPASTPRSFSTKSSRRVTPVVPPLICATRCRRRNGASAGFCSPATRSISHPMGPGKALAERQLAAVNRLLASYDGFNASLQRLTTVINRELCQDATRPSR